MDNKVNFTSTDEKSGRQLVISQNAEIEFIENPHKPGQVFFVCGSITGYVSPALQEVYETAELDDMKYAKVSMNGGAAVPCLMVVGNSKKNVKRSLGADLLR